MLQESDYEWLASEQAIATWRMMHSTRTGPEGFVGGQVHQVTNKRYETLLREQWELSHIAKAKFPNHESWFWTRTLLEQSSDAWCAAETAKDFPNNTRIVDLCCGAGADAMALAACDHVVLAVDQSPISVSLLKANAKLQGQRLDVRCEAAEAIELRPEDYLNIDPDRRPTGKRATSIEGLQPSWNVVSRLIAGSRGASIKVAPATEWTELDQEPDSVRFLSRDRSVRQQRWLWRLDRWPKGSIVVSAHSKSEWSHEVFPQGDQNSVLAGHVHAKEPGDYVADYDPVIRAARVSTAFASRIGCKMLDSAGGYFTADDCAPHGMVRWFRVIDVLSMDSKKLRAYARSARVGAWELKSRGVTIDLDKVRKELPTAADSSKSCTLLFSKISGRPRVIVAEPIGGWGIPLSN